MQGLGGERVKKFGMVGTWKRRWGGAKRRPDHGAFQALWSLDLILGKYQNWFKERQDWSRVEF